ncbi:MAG: hypothetical protein R6U88_05245 [Candidatus Bipolaricaulota bacterium]
MRQLQVKRGSSADVEQALALWKECFPMAWGTDALDVGAVRRVVRILLGARRLPLRTLQWLGSSAEFWVAHQGDHLLGVMGQLGEQSPRLTGLVLRSDVRGTGVGQLFLNAVLAKHDAAGTEFVRALPAREGWGRQALARAGFVELGDIWDYELLLPLPVGVRPGASVRWLRRRERRELVRAAMQVGNLARAVTLDGTYGAPLVSVMGLREGVAVGKRQAIASVEYNAYQSWAQVRLCASNGQEDNVLLLQALAGDLARTGLQGLRVAMWGGNTATHAAMEEWGARLSGNWTWLARARPKG